jgi:hypothetical protein
MEKAREEFIDLIVRYRKIKPHDITVVFDGHKTGSGVENSMVRGSVKIIYSRLGERADDVIKRIISRERKEWIVVSSDRDIANHAWAVNAIPVPSDTFYTIVSRQTGTDASMEDEPEAKEIAEDYEDYPARKGSSHQLSKKEKAIRKALSKL